MSLDSLARSLAVQARAVDAYPGAMLGAYRILECIGDGGMGRVYRAEHVELGRPAAIKFLLPHYAADPEAVSRFLQEAKAVNMVRHANLVDIYDVFIDPERGLRAYVMELLSGRSLRDAMMQQPLGLEAILAITRQAASALHAVHGAGIVHRDLKPENIYLCRGADGGIVVKLLDFGVAKFTRGELPYQTGAGIAVGSPWYMAPEQVREGQVDRRADVYSLGVLLYEMLTGCVPFKGYSVALVVQGHLTEAPPPLRRRDGWEPPAKIRAAVLRCLEKDPAARPADMATAWRELALAAGPGLAALTALVPSFDAEPDRAPVSDLETPRIVVKAAPAKRLRAALSRMPTRRLAALSFVVGLIGGLSAFASVTAPELDATLLPRSASTPVKPKRTTPALIQRRAPAPTIAVSMMAPDAEPRTPSKPQATITRATSKRRAATRSSRWSKEAFDKKRASAKR